MRMKPKDRRNELFEHAVALATEHGYMMLRRSDIAERGGVAEALVSHYFGTMKALRRDVMRAAVKRKLLAIIAQGLAMSDQQALKAPADVQQQALCALGRP
jgi:AcrR family transcriptional regulator